LVLEQTPTVPMLNVLTFRSEFDPPWPSRSHTTPITLNRLERPQVEAFILHLGGDKALPSEVVEHIVDKTDGVPLYVEELTKMLFASGLLSEEVNHYVLTGPLSTVTIPDTLQDSLMARLDQMNAAKEVAQLGAVIGREFPYDMLQAISSQDDETIQASLAQLVEAELLYQRGRAPRARYIFKHVLIQDAAYASLLRSTRQQVHQRIAQRFVERFTETVAMQPELVAHHYTEANCPEQALPYWQRAGEHAAQHSAYAEAIAHLRQSLDLLTSLPDTLQRQQRELDLQVALGPALMATKGHGDPDVERAYNRARELCEQVGDTLKLFPVLRGLTAHYMVGGKLQTAHRLGEQLLLLAASQQEAAPLMHAHYMLGVVLLWQGEAAAAHTHHNESLAIYTPQAHRDLLLHYGVDLGVVCRAHMFYELWQLGYPDQALQHSQAARTPSQAASHPYSLALSLLLAAVLHQCRYEVQATYEQSEALKKLATEQGFALWLAWGMALRGWALAMQGQWEPGIAEIRQGPAADLAQGGKMMQPYFLGLLATAYGESGQPETALSLLTEALTAMQATGARFYGAELYRLKGELLLKADCGLRDAELTPEDYFNQALDLARSQQAKAWELRAATSLARLWQSQGKRQDAYDQLAPVYGWFSEGFDTADLKDAKALLVELS
jgi:predicted ATPase